jgi:hypothetical protein
MPALRNRELNTAVVGAPTDGEPLVRRDPIETMDEHS